MYKHILLIGLNFQFKQDTGDKNFWSTLIPLLAENFNKITIFSVREHENSKEYKKIKNCEIAINYISPKILETPHVKYSHPKIFWRKGAFPSGIGIIEKMLNIKTFIKKIKSLHTKCKISHIHLMDNFGLGNKILAKIANNLGVSTSVSAMAYQGKNPLIYHPYLKLSYNSKHLTVVPYSKTFENKLLKIGITKCKINRIPWGVIPNKTVCHNKEYYKRKIGLPSSKILFLWSGYIQQIQKKDFFYAIDYAYNSLNNGLNAIFYFAFKPESFEDEFYKFNNPKLGVYIKPTSTSLFNDLKYASDVFYSLIINRKCIIAPPLTWIEVMNLGIPVLTNNVPGASEIIEDGKNGYLINNNSELIKKINMISKNFNKMRVNCIKKINKDYNIYKISNMYINLFLRKEKINEIPC